MDLKSGPKLAVTFAQRQTHVTVIHTHRMCSDSILTCSSKYCNAIWGTVKCARVEPDRDVLVTCILCMQQKKLGDEDCSKASLRDYRISEDD